MLLSARYEEILTLPDAFIEVGFGGLIGEELQMSRLPEFLKQVYSPVQGGALPLRRKGDEHDEEVRVEEESLIPLEPNFSL